MTAAEVRDRFELESAIMEFAREPNSGLYLLPDSFTSTNRDLVVELAARYRLPSVYGRRIFVEQGGLMSSRRRLEALLENVAVSPRRAQRTLGGPSRCFTRCSRSPSRWRAKASSIHSRIRTDSPTRAKGYRRWDRRVLDADRCRIKTGVIAHRLRAFQLGRPRKNMPSPFRATLHHHLWKIRRKPTMKLQQRAVHAEKWVRPVKRADGDEMGDQGA
jgi:hypothetical protein